MTRAIAAMEHRSSGQMGHPAACMIENNPVLSGASGFWDARLWTRPGPAVMRFIGSLWPKRHRSPDNPPLMWITLWATRLQSAPSHENSGAATVCSKLRQKEVVENQSLARI
jgi:hypothetical protein